MTPVTQLLVVILAAIGLTILAERRQIQAPLLLTLVGLVASFIPGLSAFDIPPELILGLVVSAIAAKGGREILAEAAEAGEKAQSEAA